MITPTGRTGRLSKPVAVRGICWEFPAGTKADEVTGIDNTGPCWLIDASNVTGSAARHDLHHRYPTTFIDNVEIDP